LAYLPIFGANGIERGIEDSNRRAAGKGRVQQVQRLTPVMPLTTRTTQIEFLLHYFKFLVTVNHKALAIAG
jgi:hypothetical protein